MKNCLFAALVSFLAVTALAGGIRQTPRDLVRYVDPFIGTGGHGHTYPGATVPCGMIQVSPDTRNGTSGRLFRISSLRHCRAGFQSQALERHRMRGPGRSLAHAHIDRRRRQGILPGKVFP